MKALKVEFGPESPCLFVVGTGGIGSGIFFQLKENHTIGRNESREGRLLDWKDYCKLHIVFHYISVFLGADPEGRRFRVLPIGKVGDDDIGRRLLEQMVSAGMDVSHIDTVPGISTLFSVCFQYPDGSGGNITSNNSASSLVTMQDIDNIHPLFAQYRRKGIAVAMPEVPLETRGQLLELATRYDFFRVAAFTPTELSIALRTQMLANVDLVTLNEDEAMTIAKVSRSGVDEWPSDEYAVDQILQRCVAFVTGQNPNVKVVITVGRKGAYGYDHGKWEYVPSFGVKPVNTAGAGDAHLSGLIISIVAGLPFIRENSLNRSDLRGPLIETSMDFAALLASLKVTSTDTIHMGADAEELCQHALRLGVRFSAGVARLFGLE